MIIILTNNIDNNLTNNNIDNNLTNNNIDNNLTNNIDSNIFKKSMSIKILIPAKIKLRGEEIGGVFRSIIFDKLKKNS